MTAVRMEEKLYTEIVIIVEVITVGAIIVGAITVKVEIKEEARA